MSEQSSDSNFCSLCQAWKGELGLEPMHTLYLDHLLSIFAEVKRVLKPSGTCWVNIGDSYAGSGSPSGDFRDGKGGDTYLRPYNRKDVPPKSLCGIPERFAIRMTDELGMIRRNTIIWHKLSAMPSSAKDRFTNDFEYVYYFTKNNKTLFWTHNITAERVDNQPLGTRGKEGTDWEWVDHKSCDGKGCKKCQDGKVKSSLWEGHDYWFKQLLEQAMGYDGRKDTLYKGGQKDMSGGKHERWQYKNLQEKGQPVHSMHLKRLIGEEYMLPVRNKRCVWTINPIPSSENHFAQFPETLVSPMLDAGCPPGGIVLDPFAGMCTVAKVAIKQGKRFIMIELSSEYAGKSEKVLKELLSQGRLPL